MAVAPRRATPRDVIRSIDQVIRYHGRRTLAPWVRLPLVGSPLCRRCHAAPRRAPRKRPPCPWSQVARARWTPPEGRRSPCPSDHSQASGSGPPLLRLRAPTLQPAPCPPPLASCDGPHRWRPLGWTGLASGTGCPSATTSRPCSLLPYLEASGLRSPYESRVSMLGVHPPLYVSSHLSVTGHPPQAKQASPRSVCEKGMPPPSVLPGDLSSLHLGTPLPLSLTGLCVLRCPPCLVSLYRLVSKGMMPTGHHRDNPPTGPLVVHMLTHSTGTKPVRSGVRVCPTEGVVPNARWRSRPPAPPRPAEGRCREQAAGTPRGEPEDGQRVGHRHAPLARQERR